MLKANLAEIARYDASIYNEILRVKEIKANFELFQNESGEYNLSFNNTPLHNMISAQKEAQKIVSDIDDISNTNSIRIIYGIGLGYLLDEFSNKSRGTIIVYEPHLEILRTVLEIVELDKILKKQNVIVCSNLNSLLKWIENLSDRETKMTFSFLTSYLNLFEEDIYKAAHTVEKINGEKQTNLNTINKIAPIAVQNTLSSLDKIIKTPFIKSLKDIYKGKCALIASAGPSLAYNIDIIKKNREKFILFAVGPAMKLLNKNGITPDFLCIVETLNTKGQIENINLKNTDLIFEPFTHNYIWNLEVKNKFLFFSQDNFINDMLAQVLFLDNSNLKSIGTVSYTALSSAHLMGFKKIILCGQDLAYKDGQCYAKGSAYEDLECILNPDTNKYEIRAVNFEDYKTRLFGKDRANSKAAEQAAKNYLMKLSSTIYTIEGQNGQMLPTQAGYALFVKYFEDFARYNPDLKLINCSTGGALIKGYENLDLADVLTNAKPVARIDLKPENPSYSKERMNNFKEKSIKLLSDTKIPVQNLIDTQEQILKEITRRKILNKNIEKFEEKTVKTIDEIAYKFLREPLGYYLCSSYTNRILDNLKNKKRNPEISNYIVKTKNSKSLALYLQNKITIALDFLSDK